jgi:transcriptional regulator with PAS, ATPase and Fis domain
VEVEAGRFREDLLYRLNVITLSVPPLRERPDDIPLLANFFLERKSNARGVKKLSPGALRRLTMYDWPGNVRELEHVVEGSVLLSTGDTIEEHDLTLHRVVQGPVRDGVDTPTASSVDDQPLSLEEVERRHIEEVLRKNSFNRAKSAEELGISKKTLYLKIKRYGLIS